MDFVRLGAAYSTTYTPDKLIEGYNSLIWTERFDQFGEFELKSFDIDGLLSQLPEDTLVSHLDTKEVMIVETHSIEMVGEGADARPEITVRGRSAGMILEHRYVNSTYQTKRTMRRTYTAKDALAVLLWQAVNNNSGKDVTRGDTDPDTATELNDYSWSTIDDIPSVMVTDAVPTASAGTARWWQLEQGILWPQFQKIMLDFDLGFRLVRPVSPNPGVGVSVASALATRGNITRTSYSDITQLRFEIYQGVDRTATVQLSQLQGHVDKPQYLFSKRDYKTMVELMSGTIGVADVYRDSTEQAYSGWKRRAMTFDAGTPELPPQPDKPDDLGKNPTAAQKDAYYDAIAAWKIKMGKWRNKRDTIYANFRAEQSKKALVELKKARRVNMFSGDMSILSPYQYKTHYNLGDKIMLFGDYGKTAAMIVTEYVRTEDANGDRGYPGLVEP